MKINPKKDMLERIAAFMRKKGMAVSDIEGGLLDMPKQGRLLIVNFLPSDETFSNGIKAIEENARAVISFLVRGKYTRGAVRTECCRFHSKVAHCVERRGRDAILDRDS